jgi:raffinose/stachyose/melibiose transport system permease protein
VRQKRLTLFYSILFLLPALAISCLLLLTPIVQAIHQSFFSWKGIAGAPMKPVGISNYVAVFNNPLFWRSLTNNLILMAGGFLVLMPLSFILALIITSDIKGVRFYKTAYFMPVMLPITAVGLMWVYMLEPNWGMVNTILRNIGLERFAIAWLAIPIVNVVVVTLVNEWIYAGLNMLIFAAGLVAIDESLYEAAQIDGTSGWQRIRFITLPLCKNSFKVFSVMCVTGCLKAFDLIYAMTKGGPNQTSEMPATFLYSQAFTYRNFGVGNAVGTIILVLGLVLSLILNKVLTQEE